jgi:glucose-6-phosphate 1-dehydrogenase
MNDEIKGWYLGLSEGKKQIFLAFVSHSLTVHGRAFGLDLAGKKQIAAFKGLNELQHHLSSQIAVIGLGRKRYPDDMFWNILDEKAGHHDISLALANSLKYARSIS